MSVRQRLRGLLGLLATGSLGATAAALLPRGTSLGTQWILGLVHGPEVVARYATAVSRGAVVTALVVMGLPSVLSARPGLVRSERGRAAVGVALLAISAVFFSITLVAELWLGAPPRAAVMSASFSAGGSFAAVAIVAWPIWQRLGRYYRVLAATLAISGAAAWSLAALNLPYASGVVTATGLSVPALHFLGRTRLRRALRLAVSLSWRAAPPSLGTFAAVIVYPTALTLGNKVVGERAVGEQVLLWAALQLFGVTSSAVAAWCLARAPAPGAPRAAGGSAGGEPAARSALRMWLLRAVPLATLGFVVFEAYAHRHAWLGRAPGQAVPLAAVLTSTAYLFSDPLCFYFAPRTVQRRLAIGSTVVAGLVWLGMSYAPEAVLPRVGVLGPSGIVATLRLLFLIGTPVQRVALPVLVLLAAAFGCAAYLGA
ncbi:MAG: hypothetical protein IT372_17445 [Polyangiaceae bacterium]|nr:hypothetical protein [Polyangiaceae bacterium]